MVDSECMRAEDSEGLLAGYVSGPAAATEATTLALARAEGARTVVLVEGVSDQIAVETLARRCGRNLAAESIVVLPIGGVHGIARYLRRFGPEGADIRLAGLCDAGEAHIVQQSLATTGLSAPGSTADLERLGFFICVKDLEDELIRAAGPARVAEVFAAHGDLGAFHTIQRQPGLARKGRGGSVAAVSRRRLAAQTALRPAADRGHQTGPGTGAAGRSARRHLTLSTSVRLKDGSQHGCGS